MPLPKTLTTVTALSKILALILFVLLPFIGFFTGIYYEKRVYIPPAYINNQVPEINMPVVNSTIKTDYYQTPQDELSQSITNPGWLRYTNKEYGFAFDFPGDWKVEEKIKKGELGKNGPIDWYYTRAIKDGYVFTFNYPLYGIGGMGSVGAKVEDIRIDGRLFKKVYANSSRQCTWARYPTPPEEQLCYSSFNTLIINNSNIAADNISLAGAFVNYNPPEDSYSMTVSFELPKAVSLGDSSFKSYTDIADKIFKSIKLPIEK